MKTIPKLSSTCMQGLLALLLSAYCLQSVRAATFVVDDSASQPEVSAQMRWRSLSPSRNQDHQVEGATLVRIRLNTQPWLSKRGKIYMVLPQQSQTQVQVDWSTQGRLLPGRLLSGQRTLVYAGLVTQTQMEDVFAVNVSADGRSLATAQRLKFHFEIDVE